MKLLICIAFHFKQERLVYLRQVLASHVTLAPKVEIIVITNTADAEERAQISLCFPPVNENIKIEINTFANPTINPWLLTWAHKPIMLEKFHSDSFTHFMYIEDDIEVTLQNIEYWLESSKHLKPLNFYPSFVRIEWSDTNEEWVLSDMHKQISISRLPRLQLKKIGHTYINLPNPYQGLFFYDRELMEEHINSNTYAAAFRYKEVETSIYMDNGGGGIAEYANFALSLYNIPQGFFSRNLVRFYEKYRSLDTRCFVHHLPNSIANNTNTNLGKVSINSFLKQ